MLLENITVKPPKTRNSENVRKCIVGIALNKPNSEIKKVCNYTSDGTIGDQRAKMRTAIKDKKLVEYLEKYRFDVKKNSDGKLSVNFPDDILALYGMAVNKFKKEDSTPTADNDN